MALTSSFDIRKRLRFGFAAAIMLVLLVGIISYNTVQRQALEADAVTHTYQVVNQLEYIQKLLIDMETGRRGFRSTNEKKFLQPYNEGLARITPAITELESLIQDNPDQGRHASAISSEIKKLLDFWSGLGDDASGYTKEQIIRVMTSEKALMDRVRLSIAEMMDVEKGLLIKRKELNKDSVSQAKWELIIGVLLILAIVIILIIQVLRELSNRKKAEKNLKQNYKELTVVNQENAERNWLLAGVAKVNDVLQGEVAASELPQVILDVVIKYLNLKAGAFYLFNAQTKKLVLTASYSLPANAQKEYDLHEGFVGQAAATKDTLVISDVPAKYAVVQGGTIQPEVVQAIYAVLQYNKELKGIIEVLSFEPIKEQNLKFLKVIGDNISVALNSAQSRVEVLQLLEQVQHQKEALENQQEELRQTNEELTVQAEVLQASEEELRVQEEELRQINAEMQEKNRAVEAAGQALELKAKELEAASKYKSEFLANMSHELRTPLNSVLILAKLLADNKEQNLTNKQVAHAKIIYKSGSDLLELINDILDLSKIEAGKVDLYVEEVKLKTIANDMEQLFGMLAEEKGIRYEVTVDPEVPATIKTDKQKVEQILKNLLSNAFKFTPKEGKVSLRFRSVKDKGSNYVAMSVSDTGIGIPLEKQKDIFEAFQQADGSTNRKFGGTGLGLSITKQLLRILNGKVEVKSEEAKGSTFTITIPEEVAAATKTSQGEILQTESLPTEKEAVTEQTRVLDDRANLKKEDKKMLIIEDDETFASVMKDFAMDNGYKTIIALSGDEGLLCARKYRPSAIILDMQLPGIDGSTLLKMFKADPDLKNIPVHIISASEEFKTSSLDALAFLKKPLEKEDLEKAFTLIGEYLHSSVKRVMILSTQEETERTLINLIRQKNYDVACDTSLSVNDALEKLQQDKYDCVIADIGSDIKDGIKKLQFLKSQLKPKAIPTIIYLDDDITPTNELELKKIADVIVRKSTASHTRLLEELELFLYKVQEKDKSRDTKVAISNVSVDDTLLQSKKVLLVDDDMRNIFALSAAIEQEQMTVLTANDGREALETLKENKDIDIVLMDIMMPEMDGYEAMQFIRNEMKLKNLPIIALTAKAMAGDKEKCIAAGASDYISKPVDTQKLVSLMRVWLS